MGLSTTGCDEPGTDTPADDARPDDTLIVDTPSADTINETDIPGDTDIDTEPAPETDLVDTPDSDIPVVEDTFADRSDTAIWIPSNQPRGVVGVFTHSACGVSPAGPLQCWGSTFPELNYCQDSLSIPPPSGSYRHVETTMGCQGPTVLLTRHRRLQLWTRNGSGLAIDRDPSEFSGKRFSAVAGTYRPCGITVHGRLVCQIDGVISPWDEWPRTGRYVDIDTYDRNSCVLSTDGWVTCWGQTPIASLNDVGIPMVDVEAGYTFACAIGVDGQVRCAEDPSSAGYRGVLYGPRNWIAGSEPAGNDFIRLAAANERACALHATGEVVCWGFDGDDTPGVLPGPGRADFTSIYMLPDTYCGMTSDGYFCWGQDWRVVDNSPAVVGAVP